MCFRLQSTLSPPPPSSFLASLRVICGRSNFMKGNKSKCGNLTTIVWRVPILTFSHPETASCDQFLIFHGTEILHRAHQPKEVHFKISNHYFYIELFATSLPDTCKSVASTVSVSVLFHPDHWHIFWTLCLIGYTREKVGKQVKSKKIIEAKADEKSEKNVLNLHLNNNINHLL